MAETEVFDIDKKADTDFIKCPGCGGNMEFNPETQDLYCSHCGSHIDFNKDSNVKEIDIENAFSLAEKWEETSVICCENCGARVVISTSEVAKACPYCGTSHIRKSADLAGIKPNAVYPFTITAAQAEDLSKKWAKKRIFAPKKFKKNIEVNNINGVYEPCFTFDSNTYSTYVGRIGKNHTRTVRTKNGTRTETYTVWRNISGTFSHFFDDVTVTAAKEMDQKVLNKISPFRRETIKVYNKDYLAGFSANHYDKELSDCWEESKNIMDEQLRSLILHQYSYDVVDYLKVKTTHNNVTYKYVLMPIYMINYLYKKKNFRVNINGNTGKVFGKTPVSFWRVLIAVAGCALLIFILALIISANGGCDGIYI